MGTHFGISVRKYAPVASFLGTKEVLAPAQTSNKGQALLLRLCIQTALKLVGAARAYPQRTYSALQSVQQEWQYLQRTTTNIESCFDRPEKAMQKGFSQHFLEKR